MELLPQSKEALDEYLAPAADALEHELRVLDAWATRVVPECVAMSVTVLDDDLTFTLVAPQFPDAGGIAAASLPDPAAPRPQPDGVDRRGAALDEEGWAEMARAGATHGIASSVSLPVLDRGRVVLSIDLYASTQHAFRGCLKDLADALGAWQAGAVTNADLGFETRRRAEAAPARLRDQRLIEIGVGLLAAREGVGIETARGLLRAGAQAAGIGEAQAALVIQAVHQH